MKGFALKPKTITAAMFNLIEDYYYYLLTVTTTTTTTIIRDYSLSLILHLIDLFLDSF